MSQASTSKWLYLQVLVAVVVGAALGHFYPDLAKEMKPLGDGFVKLVRMLIAPIIFLTVVVGIGKLSNSASVGRIGIKAIVYFEVLTTLAMLIGLGWAISWRRGRGSTPIRPSSTPRRWPPSSTRRMQPSPISC